ncbi:alpha/beta hydrolase, partial [Natronoarchaeum mannanilyticum]
LDLRALSALAPTARLAPDLDAVAAFDRIDCPAQVIVGERDDTVDWEPVAERAAELGHAVERLPADHFFVGRHDRVGELAAAFLASELRETS